ncbi:MAG: hypothetical protein ACE5KV_03365 [Thermoplasmata archaeon]
MKKEGRRQPKNAVVAVVLSLIVVLIFYLATVQIGGYETVDILGGAVYTFILSMIVSFSVVPKLSSSLSGRREATNTQRGEALNEE